MQGKKTERSSRFVTRESESCVTLAVWALREQLQSISPLLCLLPGKMPWQELPLPEGWEEARDYNIDHATKTTSWVDLQDRRGRTDRRRLSQSAGEEPEERALGGLYEGKPAANLQEMPAATGCSLAAGLGSLASAFPGGPQLVRCDQWQVERVRGGLYEGRPAAKL
ncbi:protein KIBRA [Crotalus adamanteus]|uniref:Protein KIBRA n=1 Tax=Crotalus adamanteus TaxID=8729 RepID=A0AAW1BAT5_CROAD